MKATNVIYIRINREHDLAASILAHKHTHTHGSFSDSYFDAHWDTCSSYFCPPFSACPCTRGSFSNKYVYKHVTNRMAIPLFHIRLWFWARTRFSWKLWIVHLLPHLFYSALDIFIASWRFFFLNRIRYLHHMKQDFSSCAYMRELINVDGLKNINSPLYIIYYMYPQWGQRTNKKKSFNI